ncbi:MAG: class I SAM-dependent methyltransferase [Candidatus Curtissbacteria bacterium]|nr:class I SAM-dependent methyltransferase [Candidatus Curtissbacteria bacterium]
MVESLVEGGSVESENGYVLLELGCGSRPLPFRASGNFRGDNYYIGVDLPRHLQEEVYSQSKWGLPNDGLKKCVERIESLDPEEQKRIGLLEADMFLGLPIGDHAVDEVYLSNVLSDPRIFYDDNSSANFVTLFCEIRRVLKVEGRLTVFTSYDPLYEKQVKQLLDENGFRIEQQYSARNPKDLEFMRRYNRDVYYGEGAYLLSAVPV